MNETFLAFYWQVAWRGLSHYQLGVATDWCLEALAVEASGYTLNQLWGIEK